MDAVLWPYDKWWRRLASRKVARLAETGGA